MSLLAVSAQCPASRHERAYHDFLPRDFLRLRPEAGVVISAASAFRTIEWGVFQPHSWSKSSSRRYPSQDQRALPAQMLVPLLRSEHTDGCCRKAPARLRMYSSRSERTPSTCRPVGIALQPFGTGDVGGGENWGRVHSRHSRSRSLRCTASRASGVRERIQAVQTTLQDALRAVQSRRWVSSSH